MPDEMAYEVTIGSQRAGSRSKEGDRLLVSLDIRLGMDGGCGCCEVELADAESAPPIRGDAVFVELDAGEGGTRVFTGEVDTVETTAAAQRITAFDAMAKLARLEIEAAFEAMTIDDIARDLMDRTGAVPGTLEKGPQLPSFVLFKGTRVLPQIRSLARLCGMDLFSDSQGRVSVAGPRTQGAEHRFEYGQNVLEISLRKASLLQDSIEIWGEGAAGTQGADKYFWLPEELSGLRGSAAVDHKGTVKPGKSGASSLREIAAVLRSKEAVDAVAKGRMDAAAARLVQGHIQVYGTPSVMPGDTAVIDRLPETHALADVFNKGDGLRIRNARHVLNLQSGFVTRMDF